MPADRRVVGHQGNANAKRAFNAKIVEEFAERVHEGQRGRSEDRAEEIAGRTREQLYNDARKLNIEGRSKMTKEQLQRRRRRSELSSHTAIQRRQQMAVQEAGEITGTKDKDYNIIWFVEQCLSNVLRLDTYIETPSARATTSWRTSFAALRRPAARAPSRARR